MLPVDNRHKKYRCRACGKIDRKSRVIGHVLKYHVPMDKVPFSCSLCNFRCLEQQELMDHVRKYRRHVDEARKHSVPDTTTLLNQAAQPIAINNYVEAIEETVEPLDPVLQPSNTVKGSVPGLVPSEQDQMKPAMNMDSSFAMGTSLPYSAIAIEPGWTTSPQIDQYDAPTPLMDEHVEGEEEFNEWLVSLVATDDQKTVTHEEPNQQVPSLTPDEQRDARSPMLLTATPEQEIVVSPTMAASPVTSAVVQDAMVDAIRQSTIQMVNAIREGQSSILSAINANHRDMLNVLKEIRDALKKK
ncbi:hypothetical protein DPMN_081017 [Dreissena polymorpha]|uniref:C2H2-type domain-containing protein n=2 Tax=Dreissena polymorpha TaxID=45954 RepID=A0A9D3Y4D5_DREPO|nr:hypothetical protein DPMN_081017 [Dreissena polymorpha]